MGGTIQTLPIQPLDKQRLLALLFSQARPGTGAPGQAPLGPRDPGEQASAAVPGPTSPWSPAAGANLSPGAISGAMTPQPSGKAPGVLARAMGSSPGRAPLSPWGVGGQPEMSPSRPAPDDEVIGNLFGNPPANGKAGSPLLSRPEFEARNPYQPPQRPDFQEPSRLSRLGMALSIGAAGFGNPHVGANMLSGYLGNLNQRRGEVRAYDENLPTMERENYDRMYGRYLDEENATRMMAEREAQTELARAKTETERRAPVEKFPPSPVPAEGGAWVAGEKGWELREGPGGKPGPADSVDVKNYNFAVSQGFQGNFEQWQKDEANRKTPRITVNPGTRPLSPYQRAQLRNQITDDYSKDLDRIQWPTIASNMEKIQTSAKNPSPAGDLSMIYGYMRMLDPGSVVRESEFRVAETARPMLERLGVSWNAVSSAWEGNKLTDSARADFLDRATQLYRGMQQQKGQIDGYYRQLATENELKPESVIKPDFVSEGLRGPGGVQTNALPAGGPPAGATHIAPGSDGKNHYTNAQGQDLGVAP